MRTCTPRGWATMILGLTLAGAVAAPPDKPAKAEARLKTTTRKVSSRPVEGVVAKIDKDGLTLVETVEFGQEPKEHHILPIDVLRDGNILPDVFGRRAYRWQDIKAGDTVELSVAEDHIDKQTYCLEINIKRRPKETLPESQKPKEDNYYLVYRLYNDLENGTDISDEDIKKAWPPRPERKDESGKVTPAHPGGLSKEWQEKLDAIRAKKKEAELKAKPPEKK